MLELIRRKSAAGEAPSPSDLESTAATATAAASTPRGKGRAEGVVQHLTAMMGSGSWVWTLGQGAVFCSCFFGSVPLVRSSQCVKVVYLAGCSPFPPLLPQGRFRRPLPRSCMPMVHLGAVPRPHHCTTAAARRSTSAQDRQLGGSSSSRGGSSRSRSSSV